MNKEQAYDEHVFPLMDQIIRICQQHKIAMVASFAIQTDKDPDLMCTTALLEDDYEPLPEQVMAYRTLRAQRAGGIAMGFKIIKEDGTTEHVVVIE